MQEEMIITFKIPESVSSNCLDEWMDLISVGMPEFLVLPRSQASEPHTRMLEDVLSIAEIILYVHGVPITRKIEIEHVEWRATEIGADLTCRVRIARPATLMLSSDLLFSAIKFSLKISDFMHRNSPSDFLAVEKCFMLIYKVFRSNFERMLPKRKSSQKIIIAAKKMSIPISSNADGTITLGHGFNSRCFNGSSTDLDSFIGADWARNKLLISQTLKSAGLPASHQVRVDTLDNAINVVKSLEFGVVVKPADGERGEGVTVDVDISNIEKAFILAKKFSRSKTVIIERQVYGTCHRVFVVSGKMLYAVKRLPIGIYSNGVNTVRDQVYEALQAQKFLPPWRGPFIPQMDEEALDALHREGLNGSSIPILGKFIPMRRIESTVAGGVDEEVTEQIHPENLRIAIEASKLFGLEVCGVDIISSDISKPWNKNGAIINELNFAPLLGGGEISLRYIEKYLTRLVPNAGRIVIEVHVGINVARHKAESRWKNLLDQGIAVYFIDHDKVFDNFYTETHVQAESVCDVVYALLRRKSVEGLIVCSRSMEHVVGLIGVLRSQGVDVAVYCDV